MTVTALRRRLYALSFIDEFGPVYAVYTLWFNDNGVSAGEISVVFLVWAFTALALEIPSGALADRVDRRRLLAAAFVIRAAGISLWLLWPTLTGVVIGAALWATHEALASGAWEALIHDELATAGHQATYGVTMARVGQFSHLGVAAGTVAGALLLWFDASLELLGWLTVVAHVGSIALVMLLPDARASGADDEERELEGGWLATLRQGLSDARNTLGVGRLVVLGALLYGLFILDEFVPLLTRARGGSDADAPIIVLVVWVGLLAGGELAARRPNDGGRFYGPLLVAASVITVFAFAVDPLWMLMLIGVGYAALEATSVVADARLQELTPVATRATVASVRGFGSGAISMLALATIGVMADGDDPTPGHYVILAALAVTALLVVRWLPKDAQMET